MSELSEQPQYYLISACVGLLLASALFHLSLRKRKLPVSVAWLGLLFGTVLSLVFAKAGYLIFKAEEQFGLYGIEALIRTHRETFCFVTGCIGYVIGVLLAVRIMKQRLPAALDSFAPAFCLMIAGVRFGEIWLGEFGLGELTMFGFPYIEDGSPFAFFPLALKNEWDEWWLAVCTLEAAAALVCMVYSLIIRNRRPGLRFHRTVFLLCAFQFVLELTRAVAMIFFFVHVEQVLCALVMIALIIQAGIRYRRTKRKTPVWAYILSFLCLLVNGLAQFALDKPYKFCEDAWFLENVGPVCLGCFILTTIGLCMIWRGLWHPVDQMTDNTVEEC